MKIIIFFKSHERLQNIIIKMIDDFKLYLVQ